MRLDFTEALCRLRADGRYRQRRVLSAVRSAEAVCEGSRVVNFCSNDYLGLADHPEVRRAFCRGAERYGVGARASHLICGHTAAHDALEQELAAFTGRERALFFSTGYMANLGVISALASRGDQVFEDRLNHASLLDGARLSGARLRRYPHADAGALADLLAASTGTTWVVSDGVFSMDGDVAPLPALARVADRHGAGLVVDDAHGFGVLGAKGAGTVEHYGLSPDDVPVLVGTLGKAFGTFGAFVAGSSELIEFLVQTARTYIYTTALPPAVAEATRASLRLVMAEGWRRERVRDLVQRFRTGASQLGLPLTESTTPIQIVPAGANETAVLLAQALFERGFWVGAVRPPTVPAGTARLRLTLTAAHEPRQVDALLDALDAVPRTYWEGLR
jgi:8-amino-7-oxononanoate synthase